MLSRHGPYDFWDAQADPEYGPGRFSMPEALRWSPDGSRFLVSWDTAGVVDLATGDEDAISRAPIVADWAPSGDAVYYFSTSQPDGAGDRRVTGFHLKELGSKPTLLFDADALAKMGLVGDPRRVPAILSLSKGRTKMIAAASLSDGGVTVLRVYDPTEEGRIDLERPSQAIPANGEVVSIAWGPDDGRLAALVRHPSGDFRMEVLDLDAETWTTLPVADLDARELKAIEVVRKVLTWG